MNTLKEIAIKHNCIQTKDPFDHYFDVYYMYFNCIKNHIKNVIEIGVQTGASVCMWKDFFNNATIHGIDIDDRCLQFEEDRIKINIGSQHDVEFLNQVAGDIGEIDIIIDDGSHHEDHQRISFETLFPYLKPKGYYIIEDLHFAYHNGSLQESQYGKCFPHITNTLINVIDDVHKVRLATIKKGSIHLQRALADDQRKFDSVCFYNGMCLIRKM